MNRDYTFLDVNEALPALLSDLLAQGNEVPSRAGMTKEFTHVGITLLQPYRRELLVAHRRPNLAAQIAETAWVLAGRDDITWLRHYLPRAANFSDDGLTWRAAYGPRLNSQMDYVVNTLRRDPTSRQAVITLWDPSVDSQPGKDIACNNWLHFLARDGYLQLHVGIRSNDIIWGWSGINTFEWSVLLEVVAGMTGLKPGAIHYSISSLHLYEHHWKRAQEIAAGPRGSDRSPISPAFDWPGVSPTELKLLLYRWFELEGQLRSGLPCPDIASFPEPMLRSWLYILEWWWTGNESRIPHGRLRTAALNYSIYPPAGSPFIREVIALHNEKAAAYGDSWCRRGEKLGILANIARKVDRVGETSDETSTDTAIDLLVYLAKYQGWLNGDSSTEAGNEVLRDVDKVNPITAARSMADWFDDLELAVDQGDTGLKTSIAAGMLLEAYAQARQLWSWG